LILVSIEFGYRIGQSRWSLYPELSRVFSPIIEGAVFGLMGRLIGFIFHGAAGRFENRRNLIAKEANAVGTAYLRLDLLPSKWQSQLREDFRAYLRLRIALIQDVTEIRATPEDLELSSVLQRKIWNDAVDAIKETGRRHKCSCCLP